MTRNAIRTKTTKNAKKTRDRNRDQRHTKTRNDIRTKTRYQVALGEGKAPATSVTGVSVSATDGYSLVSFSK
jgi:hypothetical protein